MFFTVTLLSPDSQAALSFTGQSTKTGLIWFCLFEFEQAAWCIIKLFETKLYNISLMNLENSCFCMKTQDHSIKASFQCDYVIREL